MRVSLCLGVTVCITLLQVDTNDALTLKLRLTPYIIDPVVVACSTAIQHTSTASSVTEQPVS